jgi:predicted ATPase/class 3 adenylate cyclase
MPEGAAAPATPVPAPSRPTSSAERRQLTVMFCDLVGFTALSARLDPEDMREIIGAYHRCCAEQITKADGFVAKYMGDGVLAYFGYPQAHEDDAERAVRAGLGLIEAVPSLHSGHDAVLQVRVGIATGLVVVGDLIGEGAAQEQSVVGETPNAAARLQALAEPDQLVIADSTRRLTGGMFEYCELGGVTLKGLADPVQAWRVTGTSAVQSRFEALHEIRLTPLVGREEELDLLMRRWQRAKSGEGQVVLLSGEPGIGKSRLTVALQERLLDEPHRRLMYFCSPHHSDSALYPIISQLERAAGFERKDTPAGRLDRLTSLLGSSADHEIDTQLLAELLSIPTDNRYAPLDLTPPRRKQKTFEALIWQLELPTRQSPVLMVYEDAHWIDPSTRELLDITIERVAHLPVLLVITFRPEFDPSWIGQPHVTALSINRLARREGAALVGSLAGNASLPGHIMAEIVERTDGVPLFVEELTKAVMEARARSEDAGATASRAPHPVLDVPATLHASLMARLDRLGPGAKEVSQIGAVIGREFAYEVLVSVAQKSDEQLQAALTRLAEAGLVYCRGTPPQATFLFKHMLVRDAAYDSLLRKTRQELHSRIAHALEATSLDTGETRPELIAHHYTEAGRAEEAVRWWRAAGERASRRSANAEAVAHLSKALELIAGFAEGRGRDLLELSVRIDLGGPLIATKGFNAAELEENYARAWALCERTGAREQAFPVLWGQYLVTGYRVEGGLSFVEEKAKRFLELAKQQGDAGLEVMGHRMLGVQRVSRGALADGRQHLERAIALYDPARDQHLTFTHVVNPRVSALVTLSLTLQYMGFLDQASRAAEQGVEEARRSDHFNTLGVALHLTGRLRAYRREGAQLRRLASELITLSREQGSSDWALAGECLLGWQEARDGALPEGLARIGRGVDALRARKLNIWLPAYALLQAELHAEAGQFDEALRLLDEASELVRTQDHTVCEAELHRLRACTELSRGASVAVVEECFDAALDVARHQSARFWELRAAVSRARYWRAEGRRAEARDLLVSIYGWFTEGFDTLDLKEAKALLEELG